MRKRGGELREKGERGKKEERGDLIKPRQGQKPHPYIKAFLFC